MMTDEEADELLLNNDWAKFSDARELLQTAAHLGAMAERKLCDVLTDDMLRYAMAVMGTGSPQEADKLRLFWRFAIEARNTSPRTPRT
jgi:hypothetical protein